MITKPKIYGFGSACVDYRIHIPDMGEGYTAKVLVDNVLELGGGACANCLVQAARLGADCTFLGKLGKDPQAETILSMFSSENIETELIDTEQGTLSPFNIAVYKGLGNERIGGYLLPNSLKSITCEEAARLAGKMEEGSSVIVEIGEIPLKSVLVFLKVASKKDIRIFVDVDLDPLKQLRAHFELFEEVLTYADIIIPSYEAVKDVYGISNRSYLTAHLSVRLKKTIVITAAEKGAYFCKDGEGAKNVPADKIKVKDTVGAGDSFHGSLIYAKAKGHSLEKAIRFAVQCAQLTCLGFGARTSMPYKSEVKQFL